MNVLYIFIVGTVFAAVAWIYATIDSRRILRAQPKGIQSVIARSGLVLDCFGLVLVLMNAIISAAAHTKWYPGDAALLFSLQPYVLAGYALTKIWYRRQMFSIVATDTEAE